VSARWQRRSRRLDDQVEIRVRDDGIGIAPDVFAGAVRAVHTYHIGRRSKVAVRNIMRLTPPSGQDCMRLDRTDRSMLAELQRDVTLSNRELAEHALLSESACLRKVHALEPRGSSIRYTGVVSQNKVGLPANVFVSITLNRGVARVQSNVALRPVRESAELQVRE
jgi:hypothetical protein